MHSSEKQTEAVDITRKAGELFKDLDDSALAKFLDLAREELKGRLASAEQKVAALKHHLGSIDIGANTTAAGKVKHNIPQTGRVSGKANKRNVVVGALTKVKSMKRGELSSAILEILASEAKASNDIAKELQMRQLPTQSLGTLLNRLKRGGKINYDESDKTYRLASKELDGAENT